MAREVDLERMAATRSNAQTVGTSSPRNCWTRRSASAEPAPRCRGRGPHREAAVAPGRRHAIAVQRLRAPADNGTVRISAKADYAVRACIELAAAGADEPTKIEALAAAQEIPHRFLEAILNDVRRAGLVESVRGAKGGYLLGRPAEAITVADVIRAVEGPLMYVRDARPPALTYSGAAETLLPLWVALRANVRAVLDAVTLADLAARRLPPHVQALSEQDSAWDNP